MRESHTYSRNRARPNEVRQTGLQSARFNQGFGGIGRGAKTSVRAHVGAPDQTTVLRDYLRSGRGPNLGNFLRRLALPQSVQHWSLTTLREKLIKIGAKIVRHARYVTFQMAEVASPRKLFRTILQRIARLKMKSPLPVPG